MTQTQLQSLIRKIVKESFRNEINDIINERMEEFENEIADAINEAVDIKLKKRIKEALSKKTLSEKIKERGGIPEDLDNDWEYLSQPDSTKTHPLREKLKTGIVDDFLAEARGGAPVSPLRKLPAPAFVDLGNPEAYSNPDEMISDLANADYGELLD